MEGESSHEITWNSALEKLLAEEGEKALGLAWLHNQCEEIYSNKNTWLNIPVIVLSTLAGTASASSTTFFEDNMKMGSLGIGAVSILVGVLNTINSYFAFAKRSEAHRIADIQFNKIYRFIAVEMTLPRSERIRAKDMLKIVREQIERLAETSPIVPESVIEKFKNKFGKDYKDVAMPDITNGLRRIQINSSMTHSPTQSFSTENPMRKKNDGDSHIGISLGGSDGDDATSKEVKQVHKE
jgi:hypothetical protein